MLIQIGESSATVTPYGSLAHFYHGVGNVRGGHGGAVQAVRRRICKILPEGWQNNVASVRCVVRRDEVISGRRSFHAPIKSSQIIQLKASQKPNLA